MTQDRLDTLLRECRAEQAKALRQNDQAWYDAQRRREVWLLGKCRPEYLIGG